MPANQKDTTAHPPAVDTAEWARRWSEHEAGVLRHAIELCRGDRHAAEDVTQETAMRLWQRPDVLVGAQSLTGWLRVVTRNIVIDRARRRAARPTEVAVSPAHEPSTDDGLDEVLGGFAVDSLLTGLSTAHREVLREVYVNDRGMTGAASVLAIPTGTVKSRCHQGLRRLRRLHQAQAA
jgi:RNA polymerase sigma-70 factor, ECF subfamily